MDFFDYDSKNNVLYINTDIILCDTKGMTPRERAKAIYKHLSLSYEERINQSKYKDVILKEIEKHPNCKISEFSNI